MTERTDALILWATVPWWPSLGQLHEHTLLEDRSFFAAVTSSPAPLTHSTLTSSAEGADDWATGAVDTTRELSRLGRAVFCTAIWVTDGKDSRERRVDVYNPYAGRTIRLTVLGKRSVAALAADVPLAVLARDGRICIAPLPVAAMLPRTSLSGVANTHADSQTGADTDERGPSRFPFYSRQYDEVRAWITNYLSGRTSDSPVFSLLVSGSPGAGKSFFMHHLSQQREVAVASPRHSRSTAAVVVEQRWLNMTEILSLDSREAVETVAVALRPPLACSAVTSPVFSSSSPSLVALPAVCVFVEHVDLLWAESGSPLVATVAYQLCASLDAAAATPVPMMVCSTATDATRVSTQLLRRLAGRRVHLSTPAATELVTFIQQRLSADGEAAVLPVWQVDLVAESLGGFSVDELLSMSVAELRRRGGGVVQEHRASGDVCGIDNRSLRGRAPAYAHLFGVDTAVEALEDLLVWPLTHLPLLRFLNVPCAKGALLCGPSGSGKTALLSALAQRLSDPTAFPAGGGVHVMVVDGLSVIEKEVGRSEKNIAALFETARSQAPTVLFLDNLDALAPPRGRATSETTTTTDRTLSTLLTEMDGVSGDPRRVVVVVASAPSASSLDPAVCRPGRLDVHVDLSHPPREVCEAVMVGRLETYIERLLTHSALQASSPSAEGVWRARLGGWVSRYLDRVLSERAGQPLSAAEVVAAMREVVLLVVEATTTSGAAASGDVEAVGRMVAAALGCDSSAAEE